MCSIDGLVCMPILRPPCLSRLSSKSFKVDKKPLIEEEKDRFSENLISPISLRREVPISVKAEKMIAHARHSCAEIIAGRDERLIVIVGPCSIHDPKQALDYASRLKAAMGNFPDLLILMRSYFEKPRTTVGWKGLINDPKLDGTFKINEGLLTARKVLRDLSEIGLPVAVELLDTISPQYLSDFITWGAIGARTTESQLHRELASGSSHPVGFKNGTDGGIAIAIDAMKSAMAPHCFLGVNQRGMASIMKTKGNSSVHVILRGGRNGPNYSEKHVSEATQMLLQQRPHDHPSIMIDCSHGNSEKNHRNQPKVIDNVCRQLVAGNPAITGVMIESNINEGRQDIPAEGPSGLKYGVSITDACIDIECTIKILQDLQCAVAERRISKRKLLAEELLCQNPKEFARFNFSIAI